VINIKSINIKKGKENKEIDTVEDSIKNPQIRNILINIIRIKTKEEQSTKIKENLEKIDLEKGMMTMYITKRKYMSEKRKGNFLRNQKTTKNKRK
jgi:hypothetical protein